MSGLRSRRKGSRVELAIVKLLQEWGFSAEKMPLSGAMGGRFSGDITVPVLGKDRKIEVKARAEGFRELYGWLEGNDYLVVKADRKPALVVLRLKDGADIAMAAEKNK